MATKKKPSFKVKKPSVIRYASKEEVRVIARDILQRDAEDLRDLAAH